MKSLKQARAYGVVSRGNSKMPGTTYAQSARKCVTGGKLVNIENSVCSKCYALRIQNFRKNVDKAWERNYNLYHTFPRNKWVDSMVFQIAHYAKTTGETYHRWFDSGDLASNQQLEDIIEVARRTPDVQHWLPTREARLFHQCWPNKWIPKNLVVRVSAPLVNQKPLSFPTTSTVHTKDTPVEGHVCPASKQGNQCGSCRACWDSTIKNISYPLH